MNSTLVWTPAKHAHALSPLPLGFGPVRGRGRGLKRCGKSQPERELAIPVPLAYHGRRTGGRVVEGTALEMRRTREGTVGSNPTLSAIKRGPCVPFFMAEWARWTAHRFDA